MHYICQQTDHLIHVKENHTARGIFIIFLFYWIPAFGMYVDMVVLFTIQSLILVACTIGWLNVKLHVWLIFHMLSEGCEVTVSTAQTAKPPKGWFFFSFISQGKESTFTYVISNNQVGQNITCLNQLESWALWTSIFFKNESNSLYEWLFVFVST